VLRRILGTKRKEVVGGWRKLHNEELHILYASPNIIMVIKSRRMRWAGDVAHMGEMRNMFRILVRKSEGKEPHVRPSLRLEDNIGMELGEIGWEGVDWMYLAKDRDQWQVLVNTVMGG